MKVAIAADKEMVAAHFGHCEGFRIVDIKDGIPVKESFMTNPGHRPGLLPELLGSEDVHVVIAGGMGQGAIDILNEKEIIVFTGATGKIEEILNKYLAGTLVSDQTVCHEHRHADNCGGHK